MLLVQLFENTQAAKARARIEHPEDMIFDGGVQGAGQALAILDQTAQNPQHVSVKLDGSPSLIMGWRDGQFVLTDKAGFTAKSYDGFTTSSDAIERMIMARKQKDTSPPAVAARKQYANKIAALYPLLREIVPPGFKGFAQGDLMWTSTPPLVDGNYQFKPNKVVYSVPANSDLGKKIGKSQAGIAIHSVYNSAEDTEPTALRDLNSLGFRHSKEVVIVPHEIEIQKQLSLPQPLFDQTKRLLSSNKNAIRDFFSPQVLAANEIKALPGLMKTFLAYKAGEGSSDLSSAAEQFVEWMDSAKSNVKPAMADRIKKWIQDHNQAYMAIWQWVAQVVQLKMDLKRQIDAQAKGTIDARLRDANEHEGFVSATPQGLIKLVNRSEFMKKEPATLSEAENNQGPRVVWTFGRMNPPTLGHRHLIDQAAKLAKGGDYWVFLSHSQDSKKNPLDWNTKLNFVQEIMPLHADHVIAIDSIKTPIAAANWLYQQGYRNLVLVVGNDRVPAMTELLTAWNSEQVRQKDGREPVTISVESAGERDPDAEGLAGISGSKARAAVANNDRKDFEDKTGLNGDLATRLFDAVKQGMQPTTKKKTVKEMWGRKKLPPQSQQAQPSKPIPPATKDPRKLADWIKMQIRTVAQSGQDPAYLLKINNWENLWWPIMRQVDGDTVSEIRKLLHNDPLTAELMQRASWTEHPRDIKESQEHQDGTIVMLRMNEQSAAQLHEWCQQNRIPCIDPQHLHLTVLYSAVPCAWAADLHLTPTLVEARVKNWSVLGEDSLTLEVECAQAEKLHHRLKGMGATHSYPNFLPHTSVVYGWPHTSTPKALPQFPLLYDTIEVKPIDPNFSLKKN